MGVLDVPLMLLGLHERTGVLVRPLGDHIHFQIPVWRDLLARFGTVDGTRENCEALMRAGESILVLPGGAREVFKHRESSTTCGFGAAGWGSWAHADVAMYRRYGEAVFQVKASM